MNAVSTSARELLTKIGIGNFNATGIVQFMFIAPATTDPKSPSIMILVRHIQKALNSMGAGIAETGYLDGPTAAALTRLVGPGWESRSWADNVAVVIDSKRMGMNLAPARTAHRSAAPAMGSFSLPDVPGGIITYAVGAYLLYRAMKKR